MKGIDLSHINLVKPKKRTKDRQSPLFNDYAWNLLEIQTCPIYGCCRRLYWNRERTWIRCKSKLHTFKLPAQKYNDIVSGKTLEDYKKFQKSLTK